MIPGLVSQEGVTTCGLHVQDLETDEELANVATVSAGNNASIGEMISLAMQKVGRQGVVTMEESRTAEDHLNVVEGMQVCLTKSAPPWLYSGSAPWWPAFIFVPKSSVCLARE